MAVATVIPKIRIWYPSEVEVFNNSTIDRLVKLGYQVYAITVEGISLGSDGATSFNAHANIFDGTGTPAVLYIDSTSVNDDVAAGDHVQECTINCVNEDGDPERVTKSTNGTTGEATAEEFQRIYSHYSSAFGTGDQDAGGNITLQDDAGGTNVYSTITAADNESDGARIWVPDGYKSIIERVTIALQDKAQAAVGNGCFVQIDKAGFEIADNTSPDASNSIVVACTNGYIDVKPQDYPDTGTTTAYYELKESLINGAETSKIYIMFILYKSARDGL